MPRAVVKLGHNYRGQAAAALETPRQTSFTLPSGVTILSSTDSEALEGVDDPHVRFLLFQKSVEHLPSLASASSHGCASRHRGSVSGPSGGTRSQRLPRNSLSENPEIISHRSHAGSGRA